MHHVGTIFLSYATEDLKYSRDAMRRLLGDMGHLADLRTELFATGPDDRRVVVMDTDQHDDLATLLREYRQRHAQRLAQRQADADRYADGLVAAWTEPEYLSRAYRRRVLPPNAIRPYVPRSCCFDTVADLLDADLSSAADVALIAAYSPMPLTVRLAVTFREQQQFQGYWAGLVQLLDARLLLLARVLVVLLAAFARRTMASVFLLVMLSSVRHFGHRSEPDHQPLPATALTFHQGLVRLAA